MSGSLQDQLLKAGLADAEKAKKMARQKRKETRVARKSRVEVVDETREAAKKALADKVQRDRELNRALNSKAERKAINAQIKQLIETNKLTKGRGDIGFNFTDGKKVKKVYVNAMEHKQLSAGVLAIVKQGDQHEIVPRQVADKIAERDESRVIAQNVNEEVVLTQEEEDWYKDHEIPDDLMW